MKHFGFVLLIFICNGSFAQNNNGFYGKKAFVQAEILMSNPLFYNLFSDEFNPAYKRSESSLMLSKDQFNLGYRVSLGYAFKRNIAFSLEIGQDNSSIYPYKVNSYYDNNSGNAYDMEFTHEMIDLNTFIIVPKFEFGNANSLLPLGLTHQLGFGLSYSQMKNKDYVYRIVNDSSGSTSYTTYSKNDKDPVDIDKYTALRKFIIMYAINMRSPITKNLLISYGLKYTLNVGKSYTYPSNANQYMDIESILEEINRQRKLSFITLNVGLTYAF